tara:strand:- start:672 stop:863 length:192 start_codon:yes stop_codon:yes gene_type:complete
MLIRLGKQVRIHLTPFFPSLTIIMSEDILEQLNKLEAQIFDLPEMQDTKDFDLNAYLNSDFDY